MPQEDVRLKAVDPENITHPLSTHEYLDINCKTYVIVCTGGSAFFIHCRYMARAGWSVWYADNSPYNAYDGLTSALQTSYRGELRAILHIFQTAGTATWIKCDCKSVVDLTNSILDNEE